MSEFWRNRHVMITGGGGFIGANLAHLLCEKSALIWGIDAVAESACLRAMGVNRQRAVIRRDIRDFDSLHFTLRHGDLSHNWSQTPEIIFHLAGQSHIAQSQMRPLETFDVNVRGTWNVLEACRDLPSLRAMVAASSNHVFGSLPKARVPTCALGHRAYPAIKQDSVRQAWLEDDPCQQTDIYGTSKGMVDLLVRSYGAMGLPVAALRHVNCFGPADPHRSHLVTGTICDLLEGKAPIIRSDGTPLKAYLHVEDVCRAYLLVAESLVNGAILPGAAVHASGSPRSVVALVEAILGVSGTALVPKILGEDASQSGYVEILDDSRLRSLGWAPRPLHEGLLETYNWYKEHGGAQWLSQ